MTRPYLKNNPLFLKSRVLAFIAICIMVYGCRKDIIGTTGPAPLNIADPKVASAKSWYENKFPQQGKNSGKAVNTVGDDFDLSKYFNPDWNGVENYTRYDDDVIEMPIDPLSQISLKLGSGSQSNSRSSVLILKQGENYRAYVMTLVGDADYMGGDASKLANNSYNKRDADFSGMVYYTTPQGKFVSGYTYKNGVIKGELKNESQNIGAGNQTIQSVKTNLVQYEVCTSWYQLVPDDSGGGYHWVYLDQTNCHMVIGPGDSGGIPPSGGGGSGGNTGGGGPGSTPTNPTPPDNPCTIQNVSSIQDGKEINAVKVQLLPGDDGGFPPLPDNPCPPAEDPIKKIIKSSSNLTTLDITRLQNILDKIMKDCIGQATYNYFNTNGIQFNFSKNSSLSAQATYNPTTNSITVKDPSTLSPANLQEEFFHAYQNKIMPGGTAQYAGTKGSANVEFEAKVLRDMNAMVYGTTGVQLAVIGNDYSSFLQDVTANYSHLPSSFTSSQLSQYFGFMSNFVNENPGYSSNLINPSLNPTAVFSLINSSNCH
jgi:hypothetical protein